MFDGIDVSIPSVRKDCIINLAGIGRTGRQILKGEPSVTLREQVEILRTLGQDVVRAFGLGDGGELFLVEPPSDVGDDIIRTWGTRSASVVRPSQLQRTVELIPEVANGDWIPDTELGVAD